MVDNPNTLVDIGNTLVEKRQEIVMHKMSKKSAKKRPIAVAVGLAVTIRELLK